MERVKTAPAPEETKPASSSTPAPTTSHERMIDLERRLNNLDPVGAASVGAVAQPMVAPAASVEAASKPVMEAAKQPAAGANTGKHNPLLVSVSA
jgi:hypothetical protein